MQSPPRRVLCVAGEGCVWVQVESGAAQRMEEQAWGALPPSSQGKRGSQDLRSSVEAGGAPLRWENPGVPASEAPRLSPQNLL